MDYYYHHYYYGGQQAYDPAYAAWYAQQQQQQQHHPSAAAGQAPGAAAAPPPLPADAPPPLPLDPMPAGEDAKPPLPPPQPPEGPPPAAAPPVQQYLPAGTTHPQQQHLPAQHYSAYTPYAGGYTPYGQGLSHASAHYQPYSSQQYAGSSTNPYAPQVNPAAAPSAARSYPPSAAVAAALRADGSSSHAPLQVSLPPAVNTPPGAAAAAAANGSSATPGGSTGAAGQPQALEAMRAAAAAVASRLTAMKGQQPAYVQVQAAAAAPAPAAAAPADPRQDALPTSLQQYVARALSLLGRTNETRLELRTVLRDVIALHKKQGTLWSTDWDKEPLPVLKSQHNNAASIIISSSNALHQHQQLQPQPAAADARGGVWDRLGRRGSGAAAPAWGSTKKRGRQAAGGGSSSDGSASDDDGGEHWGSQQHKRHAGGRGRAAQQQQQRGKKGAKGKAAGKARGKVSSEDAAKHAAREARFASHQGRGGGASGGWDASDPEDDGYDAGGFLVGTSSSLEKGYFRLTRAPLPEEVRPQPVLEAALARLLGMIVLRQDKYLYYNDQFKAMRQDLTVQGIKNGFTVQVYEAHARAALEYGDNAEYNQCQTQLAILYSAGLPGSHAEFGAYRLLYQSVHAAAGEGRKVLGTMRQLLGNKVGEVAGSPAVQHALQVREALFSSNVSQFFRLYAQAPRLGRRLMDVAVASLRWKALNTLVRAHKPGPLPLPFLAGALGFVFQPAAAAAGGAGGSPGAAGPVSQQLAALTIDEAGQLLPGCSEQSCAGDNAPAADEQAGLQACLEWCQAHGAIFDDVADKGCCCLLTKECWSRLFVPQDTTKVAHGDVNLDIRDFLAL